MSNFPFINVKGGVVKTTTAVVVAVMCIACRTLAAPPNVTATLASIEKLPRSERLKAYESLADLRELSDADRVRAIQAFAAHAKVVSPAYGRSSVPIDEKRWEQMLRYAYERDAKHTDTMFALCRLLVNQQKYAEALPVAQAYRQASSDAHAANAWVAWCEAKLSKSSLPQPPDVPLHFCVPTRNPAAHAKATEALCESEVDLFNDKFRALGNRPLVRFTFAGFTSYDVARQSKSELLDFGDSQTPYESGKVTKAFNACDDAKIRNKRAINVYIYDSYNDKVKFRDQTSHGTRNSNHPYVLIDWERLGGHLQNAEPHEMGHAFGLDHVGVPGAKIDTPTNIMTSAGENFGSGGDRTLGFSEDQEALVLYHAKRTASRLGLSR